MIVEQTLKVTALHIPRVSLPSLNRVASAGFRLRGSAGGRCLKAQHGGSIVFGSRLHGVFVTVERLRRGLDCREAAHAQ